LSLTLLLNILSIPNDDISKNIHYLFFEQGSCYKTGLQNFMGMVNLIKESLRCDLRSTSAITICEYSTPR
jgi:hypothetical protein